MTPKASSVQCWYLTTRFLRRSYAAAEANIGQATERCHHQQHIHQLQLEHSYGSSIDVEGSNNTEVVAAIYMPDCSAGKTMGGIYSGGTGNNSVDAIISEVDRKVYCPSHSRTVLLSLTEQFQQNTYFDLCSIYFLFGFGGNACLLFCFFLGLHYRYPSI